MSNQNDCFFISYANTNYKIADSNDLRKKRSSKNNRQLLDNIDGNPVLLSTVALATVAIAGIARETGLGDAFFDTFANLIS